MFFMVFGLCFYQCLGSFFVLDVWLTLISPKICLFPDSLLLKCDSLMLLLSEMWQNWLFLWFRFHNVSTVNESLWAFLAFSSHFTEQRINEMIDLFSFWTAGLIRSQKLKEKSSIFLLVIRLLIHFPPWSILTTENIWKPINTKLISMSPSWLINQLID